MFPKRSNIEANEEERLMPKGQNIQHSTFNILCRNHPNTLEQISSSSSFSFSSSNPCRVATNEIQGFHFNRRYATNFEDENENEDEDDSVSNEWFLQSTFNIQRPSRNSPRRGAVG